MSKSTDARVMAVMALGEVLDHGRSLAETEAFDKLSEPRDQGFARHLSYGVLRWYSALEWLSQQLLERALKRKDRDIQRLLLIGLFQAWKDDTAAHAAVHATAETARRLRKPWAVGLLNAVLRRFFREREMLLEGLSTSAAHLAHPDWLLRYLQADWPEQWPAIVAANNRQAPLQLRVNLSRTSREAALQQLASAGIEASASEVCVSGIELASALPVERVPGFTEGLFSVQDYAAQLAAPLLDARSGHRVLDACAAPGGKTGHLLEHTPGIELTALDLSAQRLRRVEENLQRLGLRAELKAADAAQTEQWWDGQPFDRILLDAPCSATGVIRRHPEIKWLRDQKQVDALLPTQQGLLTALWPLLRPGGILVYATCSVLRRENNQQIQAFLEKHSDARYREPAIPGLPAAPGKQLLPGAVNSDGFYYALLHRHSDS